MTNKLMIEKITCEYLIEPIGLDTPEPRFSWTADGLTGRQTAYQMQVTSAADDSLIWDSDWVTGSASAMVSYQGLPLEEETDYVLRLRIRDESNNESDWSSGFNFGTAFFNPAASEWDHLWLSPTEYSDLSPSFRREFSIDKPLARARAYFTGIGYGQLFINGQLLGNSELDPAWTDYSKSVMYITYDITTQLTAGANAVGVRLGNGWFISSFFKAPQFALKMHLFYEDGTDEWIDSSSRRDWLVSYDGEIRQNSIYDGEFIDARRQQTDWNQPGYDTTGKEAGLWVMPLKAEPPGGIMKSQLLEPIKIIDSWQPAAISEPHEGIYVLDAGQNISGWVTARLKGRSGQEIHLQYSEAVNPDGTVNTTNLRTADSAGAYILSGGTDFFRPSFTFHGFRYVQISGLDSQPDPEQWTVEVVHSGVEPAGCFETSDELINAIQQMCWWTECTNLMGVPTDCPQRDERLGWLNDMTARAESSLYHFNLGGLFGKWLEDIAEAQGEVTGAITDTAPFRGFGRQPADPVCGSYLIIPWLMYLFYGDEAVLRKHYDGMSRWVRYLDGQSDSGIIRYSYFGDWASPIAGAIEGSNGCGAVSSITPGSLMSTGYLYYNARLMGKIAAIIEAEEDYDYYSTLAARTAEAFNREFFNEEQGYYALNSQASNIFALRLGLVPEDRIPEVLSHVLRDLEANDGAFTTGNQCTKYLLEVLSDYGYEDTAFELAIRRDYPSWAYMLEHGATTVWERWEHVTSGPQIGMASLNHPMNAVISGWFYKYLCGIRPSEAGPGFEEFIVEPVFPAKLGHAEAELKTAKGAVVVSWTRQEDDVILSVNVPFNSQAKVRLHLEYVVDDVNFAEQSGKQETILQPGVHELHLKQQASVDGSTEEGSR